MKVHFRQVCEGRDARALMQEDSLRALFTKDAGAEVVEAATEDPDSRLFRDLPGFAPGPGRATFIGLANLPQQMLGRNWLICTRPLGVELADFAARNGLNLDDSAGWVVPLLRNFEATVFLDIATFNASKGYSPWSRLHVAPNFPVVPQVTDASFDKARIALILHAPLQADSKLSAQLAELGTVRTVDTDTTAIAAREALAGSNVHVHVGYSPQAPVTGMSPFDSAMSRTYTAVLAEGPNEPAQYGEYLPKVMAARTYCAIAHSPVGAIEVCETMIDRFTVMARNGFRLNPELVSYGRDNDIQRTKSLRRFLRFIEND